ncbi:YIP1 family protein [Halapricum desulfuricans]|uniref:YIP1 family protein n=1 Tax=Halapricum desulfuricans TaxID=2841257 RepID=UPI001E3DC2D5|nr:YIP1 family protein [Halapricum desulfuricans]
MQINPELFIDPNDFFEKLGEPTMGSSVKIIVIVAVTNTIPIFYLIYLVWNTFQPGVLKLAVMFGTVLGAISGIFGTFVIWFITTCAIVAVSGLLFDGKGTLRKAMKYISWGFIPAIIAGLLSSLLILVSLQGVVIPERPETMAQSVVRAQQGVITVFIAIIRSMSLIWMGVLWTFGIKHARKISIREAAVSAAPPVVFGIIWIVMQST